MGLRQFFDGLFKQKEQLPLREHWRMTAYYKGTKKVAKVLEGKNIICTVGKGHIADMLIDKDGYDTGFTWCAVGSGVTTPAIGDTQLTNEGGGVAMRKAITSRTRVGNVMTLSTFFTSAEAILNIKEAGIFGHSTAGAAENSGVMLSHWLTSFDNSGDDYDVTFDYVLTIG